MYLGEALKFPQFSVNIVESEMDEGRAEKGFWSVTWNKSVLCVAERALGSASGAREVQSVEWLDALFTRNPAWKEREDLHS